MRTSEPYVGLTGMKHAVIYEGDVWQPIGGTIIESRRVSDCEVDHDIVNRHGQRETVRVLTAKRNDGE